MSVGTSPARLRKSDLVWEPSSETGLPISRKTPNLTTLTRMPSLGGHPPLLPQLQLSRQNPDSITSQRH